MATPASTDASEIRRRGRRRLIGAIVLVVLAVVFVPMIFDSEPRPKRAEPSLDIPSKESVAPLPSPAPAPKKAAATAPAPTPTPITPVETAAPKVTPQPAAPAAKAETPPAPKLEGFAVQIGAFKDEEKLKQAQEKIARARLPHYIERRGDLNRLRAGPYATREAAEKALASVKTAGLQGQVVPLP